jgi:hypothetical protein
MTTCKTSLLVSLFAKPQELPISQLAMHVDPLHLVITDKWRPVAQLVSRRNTLPPSWCGPSYKAHYPFQLSCCTLNPRVNPQQSGPPKIFLLYMWLGFCSAVPYSDIIWKLFSYQGKADELSNMQEWS